MIALIVTLPVLVPELVIEPTLLTAGPERTMPPAVVLLFCRVRLPVPLIFRFSVSTPVPAFWMVLAAPNTRPVLMVLAALSPLATKIPAPVVLPRLMDVPVRVMATLSSKVMLLADWTPSTTIVPVVPDVPAEIKRSSALVVVGVKVFVTPLESEFQKLLRPQVPAAAPEPAVVPLVSQ